MNDNKRRIAIAKKALEEMAGFDPYGWQSNLVDLLTDLRHFADHKQLDFHAALDSSYEHYLAERYE